ncbi:MAG: hypothetical protein FRX49_11149 [Trebouxia sp. A1-2]|nr:MAG: hypothetical protein FRX49_11149 [Trebouxia sp. A1-2]
MLSDHVLNQQPPGIRSIASTTCSIFRGISRGSTSATRKPSNGAKPSSSSPCTISSCATAVEYRLAASPYDN